LVVLLVLGINKEQTTNTMGTSTLQRTATFQASLDHYPDIEFAPPRRSKTSWGRISGNERKGRRSLEGFESEHYVPPHLRTRSYKEHVETIVMQAHNIQKPTREETTRDGKGTGFPEPLSESMCFPTMFIERS
jgi:hypothetical protein